MEEEKFVKKENEVTNMNNSNNKNGIIAFLVVIIFVLIGIVVYFAFIKGDGKPVDNNGDNNHQQENNNQKNENNEKNYDNNLTSDDTVESGVYGTAYVEGYAKVEKKSLCNDGPDECPKDEPKVDVVSFYVTNYKVDEINDWFSNDGNGEYISLGCLENGLVNIIAMADEFYKGDNPNSQENYSREIKLSKADSDKIIASNINNPIVLKIEKKKMKKGIRHGMYMCNSLITGVEVIK